MVPDACVDIMWTSNGDLFVAGPDTAPWTAQLSAGSTIMGVRLRPGVAPAVLAVPAYELRDQRVALEDVWGARARALIPKLEGAADTRTVHELLKSAVMECLAARAPDPLVQHAVRALRSRRVTVGEVASEMRVGPRRLHRRCTAALGYGPKLLDRVLRFQRFVTLLWARTDEGSRLADLATQAGYSDQAHLTRECREFAGMTPKRLSETFNTSAPALP